MQPSQRQKIAQIMFIKMSNIFLVDKNYLATMPPAALHSAAVLETQPWPLQAI